MPTKNLPAEVARLLWELDPATVDLARHADYVMERVMSRGAWSAMRWLRSTYPADKIADFLARRGDRLSARDLAYWSTIVGVEPPNRRGGGRPAWAGP